MSVCASSTPSSPSCGGGGYPADGGPLSCPAVSVNPCVAVREKGDAMISDVAQRTKRLIGQDIATGNQPGDFGPQLRPGDWTYCQNRAADMGAIVRQYDKYRNALPYARAANDVNKLKDAPGSSAKGGRCLTRLPDTGLDLNKALHLPPGTITD